MEWINKKGKLPSIYSTNKREKMLGIFKHHQITRNNKGLLTEKQYNDLNKIPGWIWGNDDLFDKKYAILSEFVQKNSRLPYSTSINKEEKKLAIFCEHIREKYKKGILSEEKKNHDE